MKNVQASERTNQRATSETVIEPQTNHPNNKQKQKYTNQCNNQRYFNAEISELCANLPLLRPLVRFTAQDEILTVRVK